MADKPFLQSQKWQEQQWRSVVDGAHPTMLEFFPGLIKRMAKLGVPMYAHCVIRSEEQQRKEFLEGNSRDSPEDGLWPHRGCAADIVHSTRHWALDDRQWLLIGHVGKEFASQRGLKVTWGGDFNPLNKHGLGWDPAHWEVMGWKTVAHEYPWPLNP